MFGYWEFDSLSGGFRAAHAISELQNSHFQNEAKCKAFLVKMSFCMRMKTHFHINDLLRASLWKKSLEQLQKANLLLAFMLAS